jgi:hypothetical protein
MPAKLPMASPPLSGEFRLMMPKDLKERLRAFNDHAVKYLIVGGYSEIFPGSRARLAGGTTVARPPDKNPGQ